MVCQVNNKDGRMLGSLLGSFGEVGQWDGDPESRYSLSEAWSPNMASCSIISMEILILGMLSR